MGSDKNSYDAAPTLLAALGAGLIFGAGLALSGMTRPEKVLDFLDVTGHWDASLLLVLGGATGVASVLFPWILRRRAPFLAVAFQTSTVTVIDRRLVVGALLFGLGWGFSGYCPGPAIALFAALPGSAREALLFLPAMLAGSWGWRLWARASAASDN